MKVKVNGKQPNSRNCFVCGLSNRFGLKADFYEMEDKSLVGLFTPKEEHQGYPGRLHGGIAGTILDEAIGRVIMVTEKDTWGVTINFEARYRKPIPLERELKVVARVTKNANRYYEGTAEIQLPNGDLAVSAGGKYMKLPIDRITAADADEEEWRVVLSDHEPDELDV
ncbi:PaaI family thioesterase [candidate division KSB1 bacterium]|nr:PaaI family thioesterase [candidate division KSB1 bacterium]